jgi:hypothetical protein
VTRRLTRILAGTLGAAARLLPPGRRQWAEAVQAEAAEVPGGWSRLRWLAGGLWLIAREGCLMRKLVYWLGMAAVAAVVAWAAWLSWRTVPAADAESTADRFRVLVGAAALLGLPWLGRSHGLFGPVGDSVAARLVRLASIAAICCLGLAVVRADSHARRNGIGSGVFSWPREIVGLALIGILLTAPFAVRARWPQAEASTLWSLTGIAAVVAGAIMPIQVFAIGYIAGILVVTSRRSPLRPAALAGGAGAGLAAGLVLAWPTLHQVSLLWLIALELVVVTFLAAAVAGAPAAWLLGSTGDPAQLRVARICQGLLAGTVTGAVTGLVLSYFFAGFVLWMLIGPMVGLAGGAAGGAFADDRPRQPGIGGARLAGVFVAQK